MDLDDVNLDVLTDDFDGCSDDDDGDVDYDFINEGTSSQLTAGRPTSTPASSCASSPPILGDDRSSPSRSLYSGILSHGGTTLVFSDSSKPHAIRRGPGRPRKEYTPGQRQIPREKGVHKRVRGGGNGNGAMRGIGQKRKLYSQWSPNIGLMNQIANTQDSFLSGLLLASPIDESSNALMTASSAASASLEQDMSLVPFQAEKLMQPPDEPPYFPERYAGKLCVLCCLGERSQLGQGEMLRIEVADTESDIASMNSSLEDRQSVSLHDDKNQRGLSGPQLSNRRQKGLNKCKNPVMASEYVDELEKVGHPESLELVHLHDCGYIYIHRSCALWSIGVINDTSGDGPLDNIPPSVSLSLARKCTYCNKFGASMSCKMSCPKFYHLPCIAASGGFQIIQNFTVFCKEHLGQVPLVCTEDINCRVCFGLGDVSNLMICSTCGDHYHGTCIGVAQLPGVRAGWQCKTCRRCQICRVPDSTDGRSLACEQCDKTYHAHCLRPIMTSIPKYGWKCRCCRVCSDCGSRTPGAGTSSRWHAHYTVCDSCYQQRNKGFSCPICHRAYRAAAYREMVKCSVCNKFVHSTCDSEAELSTYHLKKEIQPDYEYSCPPCKMSMQSGRLAATMRRNSSIDEESLSASQESLYTEDVSMDTDCSDKILDVGLGKGKGKPFAASKDAKKRMGIPIGGRPKGVGKIAFQKRQRASDLTRKRGPKTKMRGIFGVPGLGLQRPTSDSTSKIDDEPGVENRLVLCSAKDKFVLTQDICVMCGACGTDQEGCLISCVQCGQCYHPYCVTVKVSKVILQKGWRCLDCTVCEGCGQKSDESRLTLCDECDISYHIYCMDPPLDFVPTGVWKCKWCAICQRCGTNSPGFNSVWQNSYSECGPCASLSSCASCSEGYADGELIIQCAQCERWLHCSCDSIKNEDEADTCSEEGYICLLCRPRDHLPPHLLPKKKAAAVIPPPPPIPKSYIKTEESTDLPAALGLDGSHFVDGIFLSEKGKQHIKSLQMELVRKKRKNKLLMVEPPPVMSSCHVMDAIESVVAGSSLNSSMDDVKLEPLDPREEAEIYKDGMVWDKSESSPPEGFTLCTTEQGILVLRKKRQRNLQKLGIGGFNVRNRTFRKDGPNKDDGDDVIEQSLLHYKENTDKKKKTIRRKPKSKLAETYPSYLQEAFFGKSLLDTTKPKFESSSSEDETKSNVSDDKTIKLSMEELKMIEAMRAKQQQQQQQQQLIDEQKKVVTAANNQSVQLKTVQQAAHRVTNIKIDPSLGLTDDIDNSDTEVLKDILPSDLLDNDLVSRIMNEDEELTKNSSTFDDITDDRELSNLERKDELADILSPHFNLEFKMDGKDVEEIFKGVLTDESQESQDQLSHGLNKPVMNNGMSQMEMSSNMNMVSSTNSGMQVHQIMQQSQPMQSSLMTHSPITSMQNKPIVSQISRQPQQNQMQVGQPPVMMPHQQTQQIQMNQRPVTQQPQQLQQQQQQSQMGMQFNSNYNEQQWTNQHQPPAMQSPQLDPAAMTPSTSEDNLNVVVSAPPSCTQKNTERMKQDEGLGDMATISAVLYANTTHPELKATYPNWTDRCKQILKKWRALPQEKKGPFLQQARDNRSALRMKKAQQVPLTSPKDAAISSSPAPLTPSTAPPSIGDHMLSDQNQRLDVQQTTHVHQIFEVQGKSGDGKLDELTQTNQTSASINSNTTTTSLTLTTSTNPVDSHLPNDKVENVPSTVLVSTTTMSTSNCLSSKNIASVEVTESNIQISSVNNDTANKTPTSSNVANNLLAQLGSGQTSIASVPSSMATSLNVIVTKPLSHFMKTVTIGTPKSGIFVPNVIATNLTPQFTLQHQFGLHNNNSSGPAPNVTVNPNGNFNTNSNAVLRPGFAFRPFNIQPGGLNFNLIGGHNNASTITSPILAAQLQTINQIASNQAQQQLQQQQSTSQHQQQINIVHYNANSNIATVTTTGPDANITLSLQKRSIETNSTNTFIPLSSAHSETLTNSLNDQQIRVLTPSEIMRTLPSLPSQDVGCSFDTTPCNVINASPSPNNLFNSNQQTNPASTTNPSTQCLPSLTTSVTTTVAQQMDQEKINSQQKSLREQEQERQWKNLQAMRAREQQMQQMQHIGGVLPEQKLQQEIDPSAQLQISTNSNDLMGPMASPSPNSRNQFAAPASKNRIIVGLPNNQNNQVAFQHPSMSRPVSVQIPRPGQIPQRMNQSPFSPQSQTPQSPHDQFPLSPAQTSIDPFSRPPSENSQQDPYLNSPQTPRSFDHQSPNPNSNNSPAYSGQSNQLVQSAPNQPSAIRMNMGGSYAKAPGTPRPHYATDPIRPTVYASTTLFGNTTSTSPFTSPRNDQFQQPQPQNQPESNRQLRDLLQRQQMITPSMPGNQQAPLMPSATPQSPRWNSDGIDESSVMSQHIQQQSQPNIPDANTFRQPLPPGMISRPQRMNMPGKIIRPGQQIVQQGSRSIIVTSDLRQRFARPPVGGVIASGQQVIAQQQTLLQQQQTFSPQQSQGVRMQTNIVNVVKSNEIQPGQVIGQRLSHQGMQPIGGMSQGTVDTAVVQPTDSDTQEIPDNVTAELEKLEHENAVMSEVEGVGDLLGDLGEDDDDELLNSLTAEMGADFNILEYADPELDTLNDGDKANLLDSLDFGEAEPEKGSVKKEPTDPSHANKAVNAAEDCNQHIVATQHIQQQTMNVTGTAPNLSIQQTLGGPVRQISNVATTQIQSQVNQQQMQQQQQQSSPQLQQQLSRLKAIQMNPQQLPPKLQQIQQQMQLQVQQAAAMGKAMQIGTQLQSKDGTIGIVTANNTVSLSHPGLYNRGGPIQNQLIAQQRISQLRLANPNIAQHTGGQPRLVLQQQSQQVRMITPGAQQQQQAVQPPPPPYPGPPPPYPGNNATQPSDSQEQPLLLEDLLEQEKREQERQAGQVTSVSSDNIPTQDANSGLLSDHDFERMRADVMNSGPQGLPAQGLLPLQHQTTPPQMTQHGAIRPKFLSRGVNQQQWRSNLAVPLHTQIGQATQSITGQNAMEGTMIRKEGCSIPLFNANLQAAPPLPPENILTEHDRQLQMAYEQWLNSQNNVLSSQLQYYETEVGKLRKVRKSLNSKQRALRKSGNELTEQDAAELAKVSTEQSIVQKQLESSRKQSRQHGLLIQDYKTKQQSKATSQMISPMSNHPNSSPAQIAPQSPLMSQSPSSQSIMQTAQSPLSNPLLQTTRSPLHSPSPLMSQSPGPGSVSSILQSPGPGNASMSPYSNMQPSPRIGTPHQQNDDASPFSPSGGAGPSQSPSLSGRLTSPAPRMTSPQHRIATSQMMAAGRMASPVNPYGQQGMAQPQMANQQQNRFIRPQMMNMQMVDRPRQTMMAMQQQTQQMQINQMQQQQQVQQQQVNRQQNSYPSSPSLGSPQPIISSQQQLNLDHIQNQRTLQLVQQRQMIQRQQQMLHQQQQQQQSNQQSVMAKMNPMMSPIQQQPPSPMLSTQLQNPPSSPMQSHIHFSGKQQQQQQQNTMMQDSSFHIQQQQQQQQTFMQQHQIENHQNINQIDSSGAAGGGLHLHNPIPLPPSFGRYGYIKLGLRGGGPMYTNFGKGAKRLPAPSGSVPTQMSQPKKDHQKETVSNTKSITVKKKIPKTTIQHNKITSLVNQDYSEYDDGSSTASSSPGTSLSLLKKSGDMHDDIVVIDSSPDEKQQIIDYDDDNDKNVVGTEVSLSSVAQNVDDGNDMSVIYSTTGSEFIVSSPLDEAVEEYPLFPCVVDYVDSDDSMKHRQNHDDDKHSELVNVQLTSPTEDERQSITIDSSDEDAKNKNPGSPEYLEGMGTIDTTTSEDHFQATEEDLMSMGSEIIIIDSSAKTPEENFAVSGVDFEAMIDSENSKDSKDDKDSVLSPPTHDVEMDIVPTKERTVITVVLPQQQNQTTTSMATSAKTSQIVTYSRLPITASTLVTSKKAGVPVYSTAAAAAAHKKFVKDATQTTAKVSIGNTTMTVPVLKNVPLTQSHAKPNEQVAKNILSQPLSLSLAKTPTVINVTLSSLNLQNTNNARIVQATLLRSTQPHQQHLNIKAQLQGQHQQQLTKPNQSKVLDTFTAKNITYSKLSSLKVTQVLPTKIFEDESISPDSSIEQDEPDLLSPEIERLDSSGSNTKPAPADIATNPCLSPLSVSSPIKPIEVDEMLSDDWKRTSPATSRSNDSIVTLLNEKSQDSLETSSSASKEKPKQQGVIPVHVIIKSRESSSSPIQNPTSQRLMTTSTMPQLSPLSQPNEITSNMANVSQQLRTIMSSINPTSSIIQQKSATTDIAISETGNGNTDNTVTRMDGTKNDATSVIFEKPRTVTVLETSDNSSSNVNTAAPKNIVPQHLGQITYAPVTASPGGNILVVKQLRTTNSSNMPSTTMNLAQRQSATIAKSMPGISVQHTQLQNSSVIINQMNVSKVSTEPSVSSVETGDQKPNIVSILSNTTSSRMTSYNDLQFTNPTSQPPTLIMATAATRSIVTSSQINSSVSSMSMSSASSTQAIQNILQSSLHSRPLSGSILGSTISQTSIKSGSTLLHSQLTSAPFRRSKSTDEPPGFVKDAPAQILGIKRHSLEVVKDDTVDATDESGCKTDSESRGCKFSNMTAPQMNNKSEDSQNVLLKQLLQNSGNSSTPSPTPNTVTRPVTTVRAPSLGVVSSLEAQLARPVIPPVPATLSSLRSSPQSSYTQTASSTFSDTTKPTNRPHQIVSRETSFVSKPVLVTSTLQPVLAPSSSIEMRKCWTQSIMKKETQQSTNVSASSNSSLMTVSSTSSASITEPPPPYPVATKKIVETTSMQQQQQQQQQQQLQQQQQQQQQLQQQQQQQQLQQQQQQQQLQQQLQLQQSQLQQQTQTQSQPQQQIQIQQTVTPQQNEQQSQAQQVQPVKSTTMTNVIIKKEIAASQPSPIIQNSPSTPSTPTIPPGPSSQSSTENKREFLDDNSQQSITSDQSLTIKAETAAKEELPDEEAMVKAAQETALELKRKKRREYQKNRRQMQILSKESQNSSTTKKKQKKMSKLDEDYDSFIDNLMVQLRLLPPMQILEPLLSRNYGICPAYGTGDLSKFNSEKDYSIASGDLKGEFGMAELPNVGDFYNTQPFGWKSPLAEQATNSTHYGFYDQEFSPIKFDGEEEIRNHKYDHISNKDRDAETPDTIISSSSPECMIWDSAPNFPCLRLINEEESDDGNDDSIVYKRMSPQIPIITPIPIRLKPGMPFIDRTLIESNNKENEVITDEIGVKSRFGPPTPLKDKNNVTVTLTLTSTAAEDILGVLRDLANILHIPPPTTYQIVERTTTPPSQKLGLYRTRGKDGKEGAPIDIQTILNGAAKFCRHCDVVILNTIIRAKASEFPLLSVNNNELVNDSDDLYFCSKSCYKQFQWRPTSILEDKSFELCGPGTRTYDDTKFNAELKDQNILLTTTSATTDEDDLKMDIDFNEADLKDVGIYIKDLDMKQEIKDEIDTSFEDSVGNVEEDRKKSRKLSEDFPDEAPSAKHHKGVRYKYYSPNCFRSPVKVKKMNEREITEMLFRMNITVTPTPKVPDDTRKCILCNQIGDLVADGPSRLLNFDVDKWVHLNCALWSDGVYETVNGALMNLENALQASLVQACTFCHHLGATIKCFKNRCNSIYHLSCAMKDNCVFYKNKTAHCAIHAPKCEKDNELTTLSVQRRVYVERDESRQVASVMHHSELSNLLRVGSLIFLNVGQLLPHQLQNFHTPNYIYPIGYKIIRFYWSMRRPNKRCRYICSIAEVGGRPEFRVLVQEPFEEDIELRDATPKAVWLRILEQLSQLRRDNKLIQIFPKYVIGEDLFGLTEPAVVRILESLPGIETLTDYRFKYGRNPLLELPLAINPSGSARTEMKPQQNLSWKKPHTQRTGSASQRPTFVASTSVVGEVACPYSKQFVHSKSSQYKKMKQEWRNNVFLARSKIQGLGLYAARDLEKHTMVIEYIGEVIRSELSELREKQYEAKNRGIYMFRLDEDRVVDATLSGGLARYINHSCNPNCVTEIVDVDRECRIIIFAKRKITRGEELSYDYKFDIEDDSHKISCMCGAPNCRKWMN